MIQEIITGITCLICGFGSGLWMDGKMNKKQIKEAEELIKSAIKQQYEVTRLIDEYKDRKEKYTHHITFNPSKEWKHIFEDYYDDLKIRFNKLETSIELVSTEDLEIELNEAIESENYEYADKIKKELISRRNENTPRNI